MINCLIVDDEPLAQDILEGYINGKENLSLVGKCNTAFEAFEILHQRQIDLMFLDVKMPGLNGVDFLKSLKSPPAVIFTTAFSEYAADSYDLDAVDYLLKPITIDRFDKSLTKFFKLQPIILDEEKNYTYFKVSGKLLKVEHATVFYVQSIKDYLLLHTNNGNLIVHMTMKYLTELLPAKHFFRVHRSYLINQAYITAIDKNQIRINEVGIPIGESYKEAINQLKIDL
ncbi:response regulator transcription factor [Pedobacter frigiditerrae]|uniref:Response regulator transcription factor n=1 Tax=Pedobacter frigiditerrae TaxID=2530452 RepID=A0A4R0N3P6_9SPHI|nr:LytTR family DNA-binding domain-containing protein [Pedobacter frigiditerrae]TCC94440.1 response regulator transcription factor [Pedobacter frigiditerrae]